MKHLKILLVEDNNLEVLNVQRELTANDVNFTMHVAQSGMDALAILMGCSSPRLENYSQTGKVQPDILLVDMDSNCTNVPELLSIMRKYYSLQKIKVFILSHTAEQLGQTEIEKIAVSGYLSKPFNLKAKGKHWEMFRAELGLNKQNAWLPFLTAMPAGSDGGSFFGSFFKSKLIGNLSFAATTKVAAGSVSALLLGTVLTGSSVNYPDPSVKQPLTHKEESRTDVHPLPSATLEDSSEEKKAEVVKHATNTSAKLNQKRKEQKVQETIAPAPAEPVTVIPEKEYKIRVIEDPDDWSTEE